MTTASRLRPPQLLARTSIYAVRALQTRLVVRASCGVALAVFALVSALAQTSASNCGPSPLAVGGQQGGVGPFDYRTEKSKIGIVEQFHFTPVVEALIRGQTTTLPGGDLHYTLAAIPNHHRALISMARYGEKMKSQQPFGVRYSVECYFDRALRFRPNDVVVRMLYATFLTSKARASEALQQLSHATLIAADNAFSHYNIGLVYFDMKEYDKALVQAHTAIALGFPQTILRDQLRAVGKWTDPVETPKLPADSAATGEPNK